MIALWMAAAAHAAVLTVCVNIETDFVDAYPDAGTMYDDFLNDNSQSRAIRGVQIQVIDNGTAAVTTDYAADSGTAAGCRGFSLVPGLLTPSGRRAGSA
jgi:hypothetical protein